jgi:hypothetical protein
MTITASRHGTSGRCAHQRCSVHGCPCRIDFSRTECLETTAMGKSTSARRFAFFGDHLADPFIVLFLAPKCEAAFLVKEGYSLAGMAELIVHLRNQVPCNSPSQSSRGDRNRRRYKPTFWESLRISLTSVVFGPTVCKAVRVARKEVFPLDVIQAQRKTELPFVFGDLTHLLCQEHEIRHRFYYGKGIQIIDGSFASVYTVPVERVILNGGPKLQMPIPQELQMMVVRWLCCEADGCLANIFHRSYIPTVRS